jgi:hypothetical protein
MINFLCKVKLCFFTFQTSIWFKKPYYTILLIIDYNCIELKKRDDIKWVIKYSYYSAYSINKLHYLHNIVINSKHITYIVVTLALGLRPRQGFAKVQAKTGSRSHIPCSRECKRVWGNEPSHSQVNSHFGSSNFNGLPNF